MKRYEGMFVVDSAVSAKDFNAVRSHIHRILEKAGAEIQASDRWDERKLAYEIKGVKRGTYILSYFLLDPTELTELNQQLQLSDMVVRHLIQQREKPIEPERRSPDEEEGAEGGDRERPRDRDRDRDRSYGARV